MGRNCLEENFAVFCKRRLKSFKNNI